MNKLYFTKYLPVEGEIKEGNKFIIDVYNSHQYGIKTAEVVGYNTIRQKENFVQILPFDKEKCKKVKLFLCSRDIQVGDKVKSLNDSIQFYPIPATQRIAKNELGNYYKVIGEVSEYALSYVTEGMEFDEDGIKNTNTRIFSHKFYIYQIKGPCGHFH